MIELLASNPIIFVIAAVGLVLAVTLHEAAHAFMADYLGDPTPRSQGRTTLNPLAHLDPLGTLMVLLFRFGWGRPVPFDPYNLKDPVRDSALVALAGPAANFAIAIVLSFILLISPESFLLDFTLTQIIFLNVMLAVFNLIPVHPLDGSKIIVALLNQETAYEYEQFMRRYGMFVLLLLIFPWNGVSPVSQLVLPVINAIVSVLT